MVMSVLVILSLIVAFAFLVVLWIKQRYSIWKNMGIPYDEPHFLFGNLKGVDLHQHEGELIEKFYYKFKGKAPIAGLFFSVQPIALILDLNLIQTILINNFSSFTDRGFYVNEKVEPLSAHLAALQGQRWKQLRLKLSPAINKPKMIFPILLNICKNLQLKITEISNEHGEFDSKDIASRYTMDIIATCVFGLDCSSLQNDDSEFFRIGRRVFENPRHGTTMSLMLVAFRRYAEHFNFKHFRDEVSEFFFRIVRETLGHRQQNDVYRDDFMNVLIAMYKDKGKESLTFNELVAQAFIFFIAGYETASTALSFCFLELSRNPAIQDKLRIHIEDVISKHNGQLTFEAVADMKYAEQVIHEILRMYSPLSNITRECTKDFQVPGTNIMINKGTLVMIPAHAIHYDPEYYPNPSTFDPERFSTENQNARPSEIYLSFGIGPRNCVGGRLGMFQVKMGLIGVLRNHMLQLSSKTKLPIKLRSQTFATCTDSPIWIKPAPVLNLKQYIM